MIMKFFAFVCFILFTLSSLAQQNDNLEESKIKVLLLGTYHFANPGADKFNVTVEDYLSKKRQNEIFDLITSLSKFNPNKIFIESGAKWQTEADSFYQEYKIDKVDISNKSFVSEKFQIGFRLAKHLKNDHIYNVDASGKWFEAEVKAYADSISFQPYLDYELKTEHYINNLNDYFRNHTIKENLFKLNDSSELLNYNHFFYNSILPLVGAGDNYIGAELAGEWYKRNLKIYGNILKNITKSDQAILILYGAGHIHILRQFFYDNPQFEVVDAQTYLK